MEPVERTVLEYVDDSLDLGDPGSSEALSMEFRRVSRLLPAEQGLYVCKCGVTFGVTSIVDHLLSHGEKIPPEELGSWVSRLDYSGGSTLEYEPHPNAGVRSDPPDGACEADRPREWCHGPGAERVVDQCADCFDAEGA